MGRLEEFNHGTEHEGMSMAEKSRAHSALVKEQALAAGDYSSPEEYDVEMAYDRHWSHGE